MQDVEVQRCVGDPFTLRKRAAGRGRDGEVGEQVWDGRGLDVEDNVAVPVAKLVWTWTLRLSPIN